MQHHTINTSFVRQFRQESILYPWQGKQRYGNICIRQMAGKKDEIAALGRLLATKMDHSVVIGDIILKLKNEEIPATRKLFEFSHTLMGKFGAYKKVESCTAAYYDQLVAVLKPFMALIKTYQKNMQLPLLKTLTDYLTDEADIEDAALICSDDIDSIWELVRRYADEMHRYYEVVNFFLQQELDNNCAAKVASRVEHYLLKLMTMIEKAICHAEFLDSRLEEWNAQMATSESGEMYN